jgi:predicted helicase
MEDIEQTYFPGMVALSEESYLAGKIKKETQILVILGNPPYSGISSNVGKWITGLIEDYKYVDGEHFGEKKHWLQDDYVKFIRFAQWKIDQNGEGVLGFITNHSYIDNPTFRGMRQSLMKSFDEIFILDLHGNTLKKEKCPDGSKDENVFDIRQGVAISLFIKKKEKKQECKIFHSDLWGLRDYKYEQLLENDFKTIKWQELKPNSPYYFFIQREEKQREIYEKYWKVTDIFPVNVTGIVTARDKFVIDFNKDVLKRRIETFKNLTISDDFVKQAFKLKDTRGWKFAKVRRELAKDENWDKYFSKILYRPFDVDRTSISYKEISTYFLH